MPETKFTSETMEEITLPKWLLGCVGLLLLFALAITGLARNTEVGTTRLEIGVPLESYVWRFEDGEKGTIRVSDANTGDVVDIVMPGHDGFIRVVLRSMAFERNQSGVGAGDKGIDKPFRVMRFADGQSAIEDTATGRIVTLRSFGWSNAAAFEALMTKAANTKNTAEKEYGRNNS